MKRFIDLKTLIAIISIAISIVLFVISKNIKELSFKNVAITELVSEKDISDESIKVFFDEEQIFNLYSISCVLNNSGNLPITKSDFADKFVIKFPDSLKILKYTIKTIPDNIVIIDTLKDGCKFSILPDLLNPNDEIELSFYVSSPSAELLPQSNSRLVGGNVLNLTTGEEIRSKTDFSNKAFARLEGPIFWIAFIYTIFFLLLMFWAVYFQKSTGVETPLGKFFLFLFFSIGLFCNLFYLIQTRF